MSNVVVYFSCIAAFADSPLTPDAVTSSTVLFSLSKARRLGSAVLEARVAQTSPVAAILQQEGGKHLFSAKVCCRLRVHICSFFDINLFSHAVHIASLLPLKLPRVRKLDPGPCRLRSGSETVNSRKISLFVKKYPKIVYFLPTGTPVFLLQIF